MIRSISTKRIILLGLWVGMVLLPQSVDADPINEAAKEGNLEEIRRLLKSGTDVNMSENTGWTALHWAAYRGQKAVAELLIEKGADITLKDNLNYTPLYLAVSYGHEDVAELLRQHGAHE